MAHYSKQNMGFTLIELLIYVAIIGGVVITFVLYTLSIAQSRNKAYVLEEVRANAQVATEIISQRIRAAKAVDTTVPGRLTITMADLSQKVIDADANGILQINEGSGYIPITSGKVRITNLTFTDLTGGSARANVKVDVTMAYVNNSGSIDYIYSQSLHTAVSLRQ